MKLNEITAADIISWQNEIISICNNGDYLKKSYLKTIHSTFSAVINHAVKYYGLQKNYAQIIGNMGTDKEVKVNYWTKEEYQKFSEVMMDRPMLYYSFQVLYWCGIREGELLALEIQDVDLKNKELHITKTLYVEKGKEIKTDPKTRKSKRTVAIPDFLALDLKDYINSLCDRNPETRLFPVKKGALIRAIHSGAREAGVKEIRVHDLRHSHVSLLINMGFSATEIAERVGHESVYITFHYAHLFPEKQKNLAKALDILYDSDDKKETE